MKATWLQAACLAAAGFAAPTAHALTLNAAGSVTDWSVTPFSDLSKGVVVHSPGSGVTSFLQNNWSPISYPGVGHVPSPGGATGEKFDLEEMHVRLVGEKLQLLMVASMNLTATSGGVTYNLGDLLLDFDDDGLFDYGLVTQANNTPTGSGTTGLTAEGLYRITSTNGLQSLPGSYLGTPTAALVGPWAVKTGSLISQPSVSDPMVIDSHSYGTIDSKNENNTFLYEFTIDLGFLPSLPDTVAFQIAMGCGNDVLRGGFELPHQPPPGSPPSPMPEPATASLSLIALAALAATSSRRPRRPRPQ